MSRNFSEVIRPVHSVFQELLSGHYYFVQAREAAEMRDCFPQFHLAFEISLIPARPAY